jgi:putative acetyltransferase
MILNLKIREAMKVDLNEIRTLFYQTIHSINKNDYPKEQLEIWSSAAESYEAWSKRIEEQYFICATLEEKIVGFSSLEKSGYLDLMYVHKDFQNVGIAKALLREIILKAEELKLKGIITESSITAKPFFEKQGFILIEENRKIYKGESFKNYKMKYLLAQPT